MFSTGIIRSSDQINQAMGRVYGYMGLAVIVSMLVSMGVGTNPELVKFFFTGVMHWIVMLAPLGAVFLLIPFMNTDPPKPAAILALAGFAGLMGLSFAIIFAVYIVLLISLSVVLCYKWLSVR